MKGEMAGIGREVERERERERSIWEKDDGYRSEGVGV